MATKPLTDARLEELRLLARVEREGSVQVLESENSAYRRMIVELIFDGYLNGINYISVSVETAMHVTDITSTVARDRSRLVATILAGQREFLYPSHKGSVRRAELAEALLTGRTTEPFGILLDGRHWRRDLSIHLQGASADHPVAVAFVDMNGLKQINDEEGHEAGDEAIRTYLNTVRTAVEGFGEGYRVGGDEVVIIMPDTTLDAARQRVVKLLELLGKELGPMGEAFSASAGVTVSKVPDEDPTKVRERADTEQYKSKKASKTTTSRSSWVCAEGGVPERVE